MFTIHYLDNDGDLCILEAIDAEEARRIAKKIIELAPITNYEFWFIGDGETDELPLDTH